MSRMRLLDSRGHDRMLAQKGAAPVTSHGPFRGYSVAGDEYEEFERFRAQRRSFATIELKEEKVKAVAKAKMDHRHDRLTALLELK